MASTQLEWQQPLRVVVATCAPVCVYVCSCCTYTAYSASGGEWVLQSHGGRFSCLFTFTFIYITNASDYCRRLGTVCTNTVSIVAGTKASAPALAKTNNKQTNINSNNNNNGCRPHQRPDSKWSAICIACSLLPLSFDFAPLGATPKVCSRRRAITKTNCKRPARGTNTKKKNNSNNKQHSWRRSWFSYGAQRVSDSSLSHALEWKHKQLFFTLCIQPKFWQWRFVANYKLINN